MRQIGKKLGTAIISAAMLATLLAPAALAHNNDRKDDDDFFATRFLSGSTTVPVSVSGPGISGSVTPAPCTNRPSGWAAPLADSNWVGTTNNDCAAGVSTGDFTYTSTFTLPANLGSYEHIWLGGRVLADDRVRVLVNGHEFASGSSSVDPTRFVTMERSWFQAGSNTLQFIVTNNGGASAVDYRATVVAFDDFDRDDRKDDRRGRDDDDDRRLRFRNFFNHGACVSAAAHKKDGGNHGAFVRFAAHNCGR